MTVMTAGTGGFSGSAPATGPNAGFDPVMKFRDKLKKKKKEVKESKENPSMPSRLFQYKVTIPEVGETIIYAGSPAELMQKMRLLINYRYRGDIKIERILPANAGKFFMDKRAKALRNVKEDLDVNENLDKQMQQQMTQQQIANEKKKVQMKSAEMQKQLQKKVQSLKNKQRIGGAQATVDR